MLLAQYTKLSLLVFNSCLLGSFLFFTLPHKIAHSQQESIVPESNITEGSSSVGDINSDSGDSSVDGANTGKNNSVSAVNDAAADISADLDAGGFDVTAPDGTPISVSADTQQTVADIVASDAQTVPPGPTTITSSNGDTVSTSGVTGVSAEIPAALARGGGDSITVESENTTVTLEIEQPNATLKIAPLMLASVPSNKFLKLKGDKMPQIDSKPLTILVKAVDKDTLEVNSYTLTGEPKLVKSAAAAVTALSLGGASPGNINLAKSIIFDTGIQPEMLVNLMLNYQGLLSNLPQTESASTSTQPVVNLVKLENSIEAHNRIITETEPEVFKALISNGEFQLISETITRLRNSL